MLSEGRSLLQSAPLLRNSPPDCSAIHSPQSALRVSTLEAVKKSEYRFQLQAKDSVLLNPASPFLKGLTPKSIAFFFRSLTKKRSRKFRGALFKGRAYS